MADFIVNFAQLFDTNNGYSLADSRPKIGLVVPSLAQIYNYCSFVMKYDTLTVLARFYGFCGKARALICTLNYLSLATNLNYSIGFFPVNENEDLWYVWNCAGCYYVRGCVVLQVL